MDDAILSFTLGEFDAARTQLEQLVASHPDLAEAWLALAEVRHAARDFVGAREAAEQALAHRPEDVHVHTTLSRVWMELGDKPKAEQHGAQARMLSWKAELREPPPSV